MPIPGLDSKGWSHHENRHRASKICAKFEVLTHLPCVPEAAVPPALLLGFYGFLRCILVECARNWSQCLPLALNVCVLAEQSGKQWYSYARHVGGKKRGEKKWRAFFSWNATKSYHKCSSQHFECFPFEALELRWATGSFSRICRTCAFGPGRWLTWLNKMDESHESWWNISEILYQGQASPLTHPHCFWDIRFSWNMLGFVLCAGHYHEGGYAWDAESLTHHVPRWSFFLFFDRHVASPMVDPHIFVLNGDLTTFCRILVVCST